MPSPDWQNANVLEWQSFANFERQESVCIERQTHVFFSWAADERQTAALNP